MPNLYDWTPVEDGTIQPGWPTPPAPPFVAIPSWNPPPVSFGVALKPLSNSGDFRTKAFAPGIGQRFPDQGAS